MEKRPLEPPELSDDLIALRRITEADLPMIAQTYVDEPELGEVLGIEEDPGVEKLAGWAATRDDGVWLKAVEPDTGRYLGDIAAHGVRWDDARVELAFTTLASERRRGIGTRMVVLMRDWLFAEGFLRVQIQTAPENAGSQGIARAAGFEFEGVLRAYFVERGRVVDAHTFGCVNEDWGG